MGFIKKIFSSNPDEVYDASNKINEIFNHFSYILKKENKSTIQEFALEPVNLAIIDSIILVAYNQTEDSSYSNSHWDYKKLRKVDSKKNLTLYGFSSLVFDQINIKHIDLVKLWKEYKFWKTSSDRSRFLNHWGTGIEMIIYEVENAGYGWDSRGLDLLFNRSLEFLNKEEYQINKTILISKN